MVKYVRALTELDSRVSDWLVSKGINPDDIDESYTILRERGVTKIQVTFYAGDFMVSPEPTFEETHSDFQSDCPHCNEAFKPLLRGNEHAACQRPCSSACAVT